MIVKVYDDVRKMKYKIKEFIDFIGTKPGSYHIYIEIDDRKEFKVSGMPARSAGFVKKGDGRAQLYISVNPCRMMIRKPKIADVTWWTCEYIDLDCERPDHSVPATDEELAGLKSDINDINNWLGMNGFMTGYMDFTGNGYRWLLPVPPVDLRKLRLEDVIMLNEQKKEFLRIMKRETGANIDTAVGELSRITGIPGTINVKARDGTDRRREPFRGCVRIGDQNLQDYIRNIELPEDATAVGGREFFGTSSDIVEGLMMKDKALRTMVQKASMYKKGHRSEYDYAMAKKLRSMGVSMQDCVTIIREYGTTKARRKEYVRTTVLNAYGGS